MNPNKSMWTSTCKLCGKGIYCYINRKPRGPWTHLETDSVYCRRSDTHSPREQATPR